MANKGFVYILTNRSIPGLVKIGSTNKSPQVRAQELSTTGVPSPFVVYASFEIEGNLSRAENSIHEHLEKFRHSSNREFFKIDPERAKNILSKFFNKKTTDEEHFENWKSQKEKDLCDAIDSVNKIYNQALRFFEFYCEKIQFFNSNAEILNLNRPNLLSQFFGNFSKSNKVREWCNNYNVWITTITQLESDIRRKCEEWKNEITKIDRKFNHGWRHSSYMDRNIKIHEQHVDTREALKTIQKIENLKISYVPPPDLINY